MVKYTNGNGETQMLTKEQFRKLMKILKKRARQQHDERIVADYVKKWN